MCGHDHAHTALADHTLDDELVGDDVANAYGRRGHTPVTLPKSLPKRKRSQLTAAAVATGTSP
jgi:hypothetical protein